MQTLGHLVLYEDHRVIFECKTLELPDRGNKRKVSRIPEGVYLVKERYSPKHFYHYHIQDVKDRTWILIHAGNFHHQIEGCILVGDHFNYIDGDGHLDVSNSRMTLNKMMVRAGKEFTLVIHDIEKKPNGDISVK